MKKIVRNMSTPESRKFWEDAGKASAEVATWPDWKRAGINVSQLRDTPRPTPKIKKARKRKAGR
jgi:hypothetical protein